MHRAVSGSVGDTAPPPPIDPTTNYDSRSRTFGSVVQPPAALPPPLRQGAGVPAWRGRPTRLLRPPGRWLPPMAPLPATAGAPRHIAQRGPEAVAGELGYSAIHA